MSQQITEAHVTQFGTNIYNLAQQKGSRLRQYTRQVKQVGRKQKFDIIGAVSAVKKTSRHSKTPQLDTPHSSRWVSLNDYEWADLVDPQDLIRMLIDPTSNYAQSAMWAMGRSFDDEIIAAAYGTSYSGEDGTTPVTLPNSQQLVPTTGSAVDKFNVGALLAIKKKFDDADVDESINRYIALASQQLQDLLGTTQVTSSDYNTVKALVKGEIDTFMGFKFIRTQRLPKGSAPTFDQTTGVVGSGSNAMTNARSVIAWAEDGIVSSVGMDIVSRVSERDDLSYAKQAYASMSVGAVRMEEAKVVVCYAKESDSVVS